MFWSTGLEDHEIPWLGSQPIVVPYGPGKLGGKVKHDQNEQVAHQHFSNIWKLLCFNDHTETDEEGGITAQSVMMAGIFRV